MKPQGHDIPFEPNLAQKGSKTENPARKFRNMQRSEQESARRENTSKKRKEGAKK